MPHLPNPRTFFTKPRLIGLALAAVWVILDQLSKNWAVKVLFWGHVPVIPDLFNLTFAMNRGVSFSLFAALPQEWLPIALGGLALIAAAGFLWWMGTQTNLLFIAGVSAMLGGALGNGIDRFRYGAVVDFIDIYYKNWHYPTFNIADIGITLGMMLVLLDAWDSHKKQEKESVL